MNIIGGIFDSSGYSIHTRELANALNKLTDVNLEIGLVQSWERQVSDSELQMIKRQNDYEINLIITNPMYWRVNCTAKRNFVYLVWEGDSVPQWILEECNNPNIEKIICPSQHTLDAVKNTSNIIPVDVPFMDKFVIVPHGVNLETFKQVPVERSDNFTFLMNKGFTNMQDRGGVQYGVQAYLEEFTNKDKVELIVKINPAYGIPDLNMLGVKKDSPKITFITELLDINQMNELYNKCDVFVSPTRAESFNLPCLEALAVGKPVITTNFGGQTDFINESNGWLIDYKLTEVTWDMFFEGIKWATPNLKHLRKLMRESIKKPVKNNCLNTAKQFTWNRTAKEINTLF